LLFARSVSRSRPGALAAVGAKLLSAAALAAMKPALERAGRQIGVALASAVRAA
jgi:hypothetical protein